MALYTMEPSNLDLKQRIAELESALLVEQEKRLKQAQRLAELESVAKVDQINPAWLNNKPPAEEPDTFPPIAVDRQVDWQDFEPIDYNEDNAGYEEIRKPSIMKKVIFILMVIITIGVVVLYLPTIIALIKSLINF